MLILLIIVLILVSKGMVLNNTKSISKDNKTEIHSIHLCSKDQHVKWLNNGKCQCCGADSGKELGICDGCRNS